MSFIIYDGEVSGVEGVGSVPALGPELPALHHHSMEIDERENDALEFIFSSAHLQGVLKKGTVNVVINYLHV